MTEQVTLSLIVDMTSDWAVRSGAGRQGALDSVVVRDRHGLPFLPASTFRGMWRDAAETLARGLDEGQVGGWSQLVDSLFGNQPALPTGSELARARRLEGPIASRVTVDDFLYGGNLGAWLSDNGRQRARDAFVFVKPGVKIDPATGSAKTDFLRFDETARAGAKLEGTATIDVSGLAVAPTVAFLLAALKLVERVGGDRRRGLGRCDVSVEMIASAALGQAPRSIDAAIGVLSRAQVAPDVAPSTPQSLSHAWRDGGSQRFRRWRVAVALESPCTIADGVQGNLITTLRHIPGSQLLGAVARLVVTGGLAESEVGTAIGNGALRVLPAYPVCADDVRAIPMPMIFEEIKQKTPAKPRFRNRLIDDATGDQYKQVRSAFVGIGADDAFAMVPSPKTRLMTRNAVDDERQKPTEASGGGVFVLEAMEAGACLMSELWLREDLAQSVNLVGKEAMIHLGRAKGAGSGRIRLKVGDEIGDIEQLQLQGSLVGRTIRALSDIVLPQGEVLATALEILLAEAGISEVCVTEDSEIRVARREGWVRAWGLPRPSLSVIQAGSVIVLDGGLDAKVARRLSRDGLGDRRAEGFGHVAVDDPLVLASGTRIANAAAISPDRAPKSVPTSATFGGRPPLSRHLGEIERAALRKLIESKAELAVADPGVRRKHFGWTASTPPTSQLGNLRAVLDSGQRPDDVVGFLDALGEDWSKKTAALFRTTDGRWVVFDILGLTDPNTQGPSATAAELRSSLVMSTVHKVLQDEKLVMETLRVTVHAAIRAHKRALEAAPPKRVETVQ